MQYHRILAVLKGELLYVKRDRRSLLVSLFLPAFTLFLTAYSIINTVAPIKLGTFDPDATAESRYLLQSLSDTSFFKLQEKKSEEELHRSIRKGKVKGGLFLPEGFTLSLLKGEETPVDIVLAVAEPLSARIYVGNFEAVLFNFPSELIDRSSFLGGLEKIEKPMSLKFKNLFNPNLDHFAFVIPALIGCILMSILPFLSAVSIVREKETGSFNRVLASPASAIDFLIGKLMVYFFLGIFQYFLLMVIGILWFDVPFRGNILEFTLVGTVFVFWTVTFGLMISTFTQTQVTALMASIALTLLPAFIFSGIFFPIPTLTLPIRLIAYTIPTGYFSEIARGIFLKGTHLWDWWRPFFGLGVITFFTFLFTLLRFKRIARGP